MAYVTGDEAEASTSYRADEEHAAEQIIPPQDSSHFLDHDGTVVKSTPFSLFGWFWGMVNFIYLLFQTLINPNFSKHGDKYVRDFRPPGSGPPKPPSRKFGGFGPSGSGPSPPPMGGCGCGG